MEGYIQFFNSFLDEYFKEKLEEDVIDVEYEEVVDVNDMIEAESNTKPTIIEELLAKEKADKSNIKATIMYQIGEIKF